jgi:hypothetical protein
MTNTVLNTLPQIIAAIRELQKELAALKAASAPAPVVEEAPRRGRRRVETVVGETPNGEAD